MKFAEAAEIFPLKFAPDKKVKLFVAGFEKVDAAKVSETFADPTTSKLKDGLVVLIPKLPLPDPLYVIAKGAV